MIKTSFLSFLMLAAAAGAAAQNVPHPPILQSVSVSGTGKVMLSPDRVTFTVGVETQSKTVG